VGLSTHDAAQIDAALADRPDYLAIGPIFPTASKDKPSPVVGLDGLRALSERVRREQPGLPIVAIGGITRERAADVGRLADAAAVIQALMPDAASASPWDEITERARALHAAICGEERAS
jgi:thiamine-phosphate pyrophosphorylase